MKRLATLSLAATLLAGTAATAAPLQHDRHELHRDRRELRHDRRELRHDRHHFRAERRWRRGERLPYEYRHGGYVVGDWRSHHLRPPPRGYRWVRHGGDYLLVAATTGLIASIIAGSR